MVIGLKEAIVAIPQSDTAGPTSSKRFSFQKNWALAELLEYHLAGKDYVFAFEFHDDILILDSEDNPQKVKFVQVKTDNTGKKWSVTRLTNKRKPKDPSKPVISIIGKLYENQTKFQGHESELRFVSNAFFSFPVVPGGTNATSLSPAEQKSISKKVKAELSLDDEIDMGSMFFERTELSVDGHQEHIKGKLHSFFEKIFGDDHGVPVGPWYRSITDEIKAKNDYEPNSITDFDDLIRNKCITRSEIDRFIVRVGQSQNNRHLWADIKAQLKTEGESLPSILKLDRSWRKYSAERLSYENRLLLSLEKEISDCLSKANDLEDISLKVLVKTVKESLHSRLYKYTAIFDSDYITIIILWHYCEQF
jgi:hypothetical protein